MTTNPVATRGFAAAGSVYERGRPNYPPQVVTALTERLHIGPETRLLDLATGTGKLARPFVGRASLVAVDPAAEMCAEFARLQPGVPVVRGNAETLPLASGSFDAATIGSAFHWFDGPRALGELHRVLRPGAGLALVWLQRDESVGWVDELVRLIDAYRPPEARRYAVTPWQTAFEAAPGATWFTPLQRVDIPFDFVVDRETAVTRTASTSFVAAMAEPRRREVLHRVARFFDEHPATRGREQIAFPHRAELFWCTRRA